MFDIRSYNQGIYYYVPLVIYIEPVVVLKPLLICLNFRIITYRHLSEENGIRALDVA